MKDFMQEYIPQPILMKLPKTDAEIVEDTLNGIQEDNQLLGLIAEAISRNSDQRIALTQQLIELNTVAAPNPIEIDLPKKIAEIEQETLKQGVVHVIEALPGESIMDAIRRMFGEDGIIG